MSATLDTSRLGEPVAIGQISRELKKLWDTGDSAPTRASLMNFAIYCRDTEALAENTELISQFTRTHACRAILVGVDRTAPEPKASAWINAHCHLTRAGAKQVCCEQITFLLEGEVKGRLTNIVFSNLDSDLPLYFWYQGELSEHLNSHLWSWINRLFVDSLAWKNPQEQFARLRKSLSEAKASLTLRDLNWTRSLSLRQALSQIFDHPDNLPHLARLRSVKFTHSPEHRSTALLLIGWLAAQLKWTLASQTPLTFTAPDGGQVAVELNSVPGEMLCTLILASDDATFTLQRDPGSHYLRGDLQLPGNHHYQHIFPAGAASTVELLNEEMARASTDQVYLRALSAIEPLL